MDDPIRRRACASLALFLLGMSLPVATTDPSGPRAGWPVTVLPDAAEGNRAGPDDVFTGWQAAAAASLLMLMSAGLAVVLPPGWCLVADVLGVAAILAGLFGGRKAHWPSPARLALAGGFSLLPIVGFLNRDYTLHVGYFLWLASFAVLAWPSRKTAAPTLRE